MKKFAVKILELIARICGALLRAIKKEAESKQLGECDYDPDAYLRACLMTDEEKKEIGDTESEPLSPEGWRYSEDVVDEFMREDD